MLAARLPGNSTYDNPRCGRIRGCRGLPHSLAPFTGRPARWPLPGGPGPVDPRTPGEAPGSARGGGRLPGFPMADNPRSGRTQQMPGVCLIPAIALPRQGSGRHR
jgi:hypothetical protein